jgi:hypothetical protein
MGKARVNAPTANTLAYRAKFVVVQPNPAVERTVASKLAPAAHFVRWASKEHYT